MASISTRRLIQFCQRVGTATRSGIDPRKLWEIEANYGSSTHRWHIGQIRNRVLAGGSVADGMRDSRGYFPSLVVQMVSIGEQTGKLDEVLLRLADYYEQRNSLRWILIFGMAWPVIQLTLAIVVIGVLIWAMGFVAGMTGGEPVDVLGIGLVGTSGMLIYFAIVGLLVGLFIVGCSAIANGWLGPTPVLIAMRLPIIGGSFEALALARLTWTLSTALESGMDARRCAELAIDATQNAYYMAHREQVGSAVAQGYEFHEAFGRSGAFPPEFLQSLHTAEIAGATNESLQRMTREYEDKARNRLRILAGLMTAAMFGLMVVVMLFLIIRLAMVVYIGPMYDAIDQLQPGR